MTFVNHSPTLTLNISPTTMDAPNPYDNTSTDLISDDSDDDNDNIATHLALDENGLEPCHHTRPPSNVADPTDLDQEMSSEHKAPPTDNDTTDTLWSPSHKEAESGSCKMSVHCYVSRRHGQCHSNAKLGENQKYEHQMGKESQENVYAPFASQLDWEVAKWAKMHGPSSTSFTELMTLDGEAKNLILTKLKIPEWLGLSFKNSHELINMIDTHLPGQPLFQQKEILVGDEVCKLYFQDIIQCIHALFGDQDFAPYLRFAPERHYTDKDKDKRVYNDIYTGAWWWFTQVSTLNNDMATWALLTQT